MSVDIQRTEVVLNNRGARGTSGTVLVSSATGQAVSLRMGLAAISSPTSGQIAFLTETGREGMFVFDSSNLTAAVGTDPAQAVYVAPSTATSGASGAWVRRYSGAVNATWFGAVADGTTNNAVALQRWLDHGGHLYLPAGEYYSASKLIIRKNVVLEGEGYGFDARIVDGSATLGYDNQPGSRIHFAAGVGGLDIQPQTTVTDVATAVAAGNAGYTQEGALYSHISDIAFVGAGTGAAATGIYSRSSVHLRNVRCLKFQGKGFDFSASSDFSDGNSEFGNADCSTLTSCRAIFCGSHGFHLRGRDVNACTLIDCWSQLNGGWGFLDESSLGNAYVGGQAATNTSGSYKCLSAIGASTYTGCFAEYDTGQAPDLSYYCVVNGGHLASAAWELNVGTNGNPTINSGRGVDASALNFTIAQPNTTLTAGNSRVYRHADRGLVLQGAPNVSGTYSHALYNAADEPVLSLHTNKNLYLQGSILIAGNQVVGPRRPAVAAPAGGAVQDSEARTAIIGVMGILAAHGLAG